MPPVSRRRPKADDYRHLTWLEHVKLRPQMFLGHDEPVAREQWTWDFDAKKPVVRTVLLAEALRKIFDEVVQNAFDNVKHGTRRVAVRVGDDDSITVCNDGATLALEPSKQDPAVYVPEMVFTRFLTGSNFVPDKAQAHEGAGMNGVGVKATFAMSDIVLLELCDGERVYTQRFADRLERIDPPSIQPAQQKKPWSTTIAFRPSLRAFKTASLAELRGPAYLYLLKCAAYHAGRVHVYWASERIHCSSLKAYAALFDVAVAHGSVEDDAFRFGVGLAPPAAGPDVEIRESCVSGIDTTEGGTHMVALEHAAVRAVQRAVQAKHRDVKVSARMVLSRLALFCFYRMRAPAFSGQTKTKLKSELPKELVEGLDKAVDAALRAAPDVLNGIVADVVARVQGKEAQALARELGGNAQKRRVDVDGLDDAEDAGKPVGGQDCMLFVVEGFSAKTLAMGGIAALGRKKYGALALRGKPKNVSNVPLAKALQLPSVKGLATAMGFKAGPFDASKLRYGKLCIMVDQDNHGAHICALVLQILKTYWPEMLTQNRVWRFVTPLVKVFRSKKDEESLRASAEFFDEDVFEEWKVAHFRTGMTTRYYKGLGSHDPQEVRGYFGPGNVGKHLKQFVYDTDGELWLYAAMSAPPEKRREWLNAAPKVHRIDYSKATLSVFEFVEVDVRRFAHEQNGAMLSSMVDGLKPVQRKILFVGLKECGNAKKVPELAGMLASQAQYHHGDDSAKNAVMNMAMSWPGSNNLACFTALGNVGSRRGASEGGDAKRARYATGDDASNPRYVAVRLSRMARLVLRSEDDAILEHVSIDGVAAEPRVYFPTVPLALVNGTSGIGVGVEASIPNFSLDRIVRVLTRFAGGEPVQDWDAAVGVPHYHGFNGTFEPHPSGAGWTCRGVFQRSGAVISVTEIPIGTSITGYRVFLGELESAGRVSNVRDRSTANVPSFEFKVADAEDKAWEPNYATLKLEQRVKFSFRFFSSTNAIKTYASLSEFMQEWVGVKLAALERRKVHVLAGMRAEAARKHRELAFMRLVKDGQVKLGRMTQVELRAVLDVHGLGAHEDELLRRSLRACAKDNVKAEQAAYDAFCESIRTYESTTAAQMWVKELGELMHEWKRERVRIDERNQA